MKLLKFVGVSDTMSLNGEEVSDELIGKSFVRCHLASQLKCDQLEKAEESDMSGRHR